VALRVSSFVEWLIDSQDGAPAWLRHYKRGPEYLAIFGAVADAVVDNDTRALTSGWVAHPFFPDDAAQYTGRERRLPQYPGESIAAYKLRLHRAWEIWGTAGSRPQLIAELAAYGLTNAFIVANHEWDGTGGHPAWATPSQDAERAKWCRFWVYVPIGNHPFGTPATFGSGRTFGDGTIFGAGNMTTQQVTDIRDIFNRFTSAHEQAVEIRFLISGSAFSAPTVWNGTSVAVNLVYAQQ
jgi:hypothetical protein